MARKVKIYADVTKGTLFFDGVRFNTPLGGVVLAVQHPTRTTKIRITRLDQFQRDGVTPKILFKRLDPARVKNEAGQELVADLGYNLGQIVDYINDQSNKKSNEIDFQKEGGLVGGGTTMNFTGAVNSLSVSNNIANINIGVGIASTGGYVGTGITTLDFRGSGVSTVTSIVSGFSTVFIEGGGGSAGNPVTSGIVTSNNNTLRLTLQDASTVDIDVSVLNQIAPVSFASSTNFFYYNTGNQLGNSQHDKNNGVVYYGTPLKRGEEMLFSPGGGDLHVGVWDGGTGISGITNVNNKANWAHKWYYRDAAPEWDNAGGTYKIKGIDLGRDIPSLGNDTFAIRFDYNSQKLQLWENNDNGVWHTSSSNVGLGTTQQYIYFSTGYDTQSTPPESLPGSITIRPHDWSRVYYTTTPTTDSIYDSGILQHDVWKSNRTLKPGQKATHVVGSNMSNQYFAVGYEGVEGSTNVYNLGTQTWRMSSSEEIMVHEDVTRNANYSTWDSSGSDNKTHEINGRTISWRYHTDNSWDVFDETTQEVILTGDDALDGNPINLWLLGSQNVAIPSQIMLDWKWEPNKKDWFMRDSDWTAGSSALVALSASGQVKPMRTYSETGVGRFGHPEWRVEWGEQLVPGQELSWTMPTHLTTTGDNFNHYQIGVTNANTIDWHTAAAFHRNGNLHGSQTGGMTVQAGISSTDTAAGVNCRLKYTFGDNKLRLETVTAGVRKTIMVGNSALDGNPIKIAVAGLRGNPPSATQGVSYYGWECVHQPLNYYNPWGNWRINGFPTNVGIATAYTENILDWGANHAWRHKDGLPKGYKMHWVTPESGVSSRIGQWKTGNATSGLNNIEVNLEYWDWAFRLSTSEHILDLKGFTFNTSNSNYNSSTIRWEDPDRGQTKVSFRYHSTDAVDLYDETNSEIIATKDVAVDGNPLYITQAFDDALVTAARQQDVFFGGGDVGIALTTTAV